jgi:hypothetical protein
MTNFAEINQANEVLRVLVIPVEEAKRGNAYLSKDLGFGGSWIKADDYAAIGGSYNQELSRFEPAKPFASWTWNEDIYQWEPPTRQPSAYHKWNEAELTWDPESI